MHRSLRIAISVIAIILSFRDQSLLAEDWAKRFRMEYPDAAVRVSNFYHNLTLSEDEVSGKQELFTEYKSLNNSMAVNVTIKGQSEGSNRVYVYRPDLFFIGHRNSLSQALVLESIRRPPSLDNLDTIRIRTRLPFAAYSWLNSTVLETIQRSTFQTDDVLERVEEDDEFLIEVFWRCTFGDENGPGLKRQGSFLFDPASNWVLREYAVGLEGKSSRMRASIKYDGSHDGIPLVSEANYWTDRDGKRSQDVKVRRLQLDLEPPPKEVFELSYYGVPDRVLAADRTWSWRVRLLVIANVLSVIAVGIYVIRKLSFHCFNTK